MIWTGVARWNIGSWPLLVGAGAFLSPAGVSAHAAHLEWTAPAICPDAMALRTAVERLLGEPLLEGDAFEARARVTLDPDASFTLVLDVRTPEGEGTRTVRAETCEGALNVAAFGIALAINPELAATTSSPEDAREPAPPLPPVPPPPAPPTEPELRPPSNPSPAPAPPRASVAELWTGAQAIVDTSLLPSPAVGFGLSVDVLLGGHFRLGGSGELFIPQRHDVASGEGGLFSLWSLHVRACYEERLGVAVAACPTLQIAQVEGEGRGASPRLTQQSLVLAPGASVLVLPNLSRRLAAVLAASIVFPVKHDTFVVNAARAAA